MDKLLASLPRTIHASLALAVIVFLDYSIKMTDLVLIDFSGHG